MNQHTKVKVNHTWNYFDIRLTAQTLHTCVRCMNLLESHNKLLDQEEKRKVKYR